MTYSWVTKQKTSNKRGHAEQVLQGRPAQLAQGRRTAAPSLLDDALERTHERHGLRSSSYPKWRRHKKRFQIFLRSLAWGFKQKGKVTFGVPAFKSDTESFRGKKRGWFEQTELQAPPSCSTKARGLSFLFCWASSSI